MENNTNSNKFFTARNTMFEAADHVKVSTAFPIEVLTLVLNYINSTPKLLLRLVCKRWENAVNTNLQNILIRRQFSNRKQKLVWRKNEVSGFNSLKLIDAFVQKVENGMKNNGLNDLNPFLKTIVVVAPPPGSNYFEEELFWEKVTNLCEKVGMHIWYLEIVWSRGAVSFYKTLNKFITSCANLRIFKIFGSISELQVTNSHMDELCQEIGNNSLLPLPKLEHLVLDMNNFPKPVLRLMSTRYFSQIKVLQTCLNHDCWATKNRGMPNLQKLEFRNASCSKTIHEVIPALLPASKLAYLIINLKPVSSADMLDMGQLLNLVSKLPALKLFELIFSPDFQPGCPKLLTATANEIEKYKSKNLKFLRVVNFSELRYDILLAFPNLQALHIIMSNTNWTEFPDIPSHAKGKEENGFPNLENVEVHKYLYSKNNGGMLQSNIWKLLPKFKSIRFDLHNPTDNALLFTQVVSRAEYVKWQMTLN